MRHFVIHCMACVLLLLMVVVELVRGELWLAFPTMCGLVAGVLNGVAMALNGGKMPVYGIDAVHSPKHSVMHAGTRCKWLCDRFHIKDCVYSIGDFFAYACQICLLGGGLVAAVRLFSK